MKTLNEFIHELKNNGFTVYSSDNKEPITYCYFVKDNNIGYVQYNYFGWFEFCTVHKPNRKNGTGYQVHTEIIEPTIKHCIDCFVGVPHWAIKKYWGRNANNKPTAEKYNSWQDYISSSLGSILKYVEL